VLNLAIVYFGGGKSERLLWLWFEAEVNVLRDEGLVDTKMTVFPNNQTTTASAAATLSNMYRLRRLDNLKPVDVR